MHRAAVLASTVLALLAAFGCGGSTPPASDPLPVSEAPPASEPVGAPSERPSVTAEACEASGGTVVGDIGDGAVHRDDYVCPSGSPPTGTIVSAPGGPINVEGAVCCPPG